jgi:rhodanese-related sulfurtransferase
MDRGDRRLYIISLIIFGLLFMALYRCYYPVNNVPCIDIADERIKDMIVLDIRDYNEATEPPIANSLHIPYAYLKQHFSNIPSKSIHIIANDEIEKNLGIRFLRRHGFDVQSYSIIHCPCRERGNEKWNTIKKSKTA